MIAGKLAIAARADAFGGHFIGDDLKASINKRLEEIREKYKEPPPPKEPKPRPERREGSSGNAGKAENVHLDHHQQGGGGGRPFRERESRRRDAIQRSRNRR